MTHVSHAMFVIFGREQVNYPIEIRLKQKKFESPYKLITEWKNLHKFIHMRHSASMS